ncbi:hypothetical protein KFE25_014316 [Diacronema lutheri]|uniref:Uncharacterized protein n=2 Tax=Diacronema lutheri TaxID=2081491 RepID=A0A8J5X7J8_DIALT|nr:hypothetical protein KFE25_014316 [Diacronema lutheri]
MAFARLLAVALVVARASAGGPLEGQVGIVTGASSGIGRVVAVELARAGMKVVLTARRAEMLDAAVAEITSAGGEAVAAPVDVSSPETIDAAFDLAEARYGKVDFCFANAGIEGTVTVPFVDQPPSNEKRILDTNVAGGALATLRRALVSFKRNGGAGGSIVFSSSLVGLLNANTMVAMHSVDPPGTNYASGFLSYAVSKVAMDGLVRMAHGLFSADGVRVYGLNICVFASEMSARASPVGAEGVVGFNPFFKTSVGDPVHIARMIIALLDGSSLWPAGSHIGIDNDATWDATRFYDLFSKPGKVEHLGFFPPDEMKGMLRDVRGGEYIFAKEEL